MATDILDACVVNFNGSFDCQVINILENVRLTRSEVENLRRLFYDLEQTLQAHWPGCIVFPFGSIVTGLGIRTSDADCYVYIPEHLRTPGEMYVMTAKYILRRRSSIFQQLFAITAAKVPIVKFFHTPTQCYCDVNFKSPNGVRNSKLIAFLLHMDKRALQFAVLLKYWSKVHKLTGTNLVPNYALTMMTIFYLQQITIVPPVMPLQQDMEPDIVDNWNTSFNYNYKHVIDNNKSLYELLGGFFEFYSNYNFNEFVISPYLGYSFKKNLFRKPELIPEFALYKQNLASGKCNRLAINVPMCVQDPFEHSRNSSMAVHPKLFRRFMSLLEHATNMFKSCSRDEFLRAILEPTPVSIAQMPVNPRPRGRNIPDRRNRVTKPKNRNNARNNMNLHTLYSELNRIRQNARRRRF